MSRGRAWAAAAGVAVTAAGADQLSKALVEANLALGEQVEVLGPLELTRVVNTGIAFGLAGGGGTAILVLTVVALVALLALFGREIDRPGMWMAVGLLAGGAAGNMIDRVTSGAVTDFIDLPSWPAFNFADIAITCGVALLIWLHLRRPHPPATRESRGSGRDVDPESGPASDG